MAAVVEVALPIFGLVLCGYAVGRTPLLKREGVKGLADFVYYVAVPVLLYRAMVEAGIPGGRDLLIVLAYFTGALAVYAAAAAISRRALGCAADAAALMGMLAAFGNTVLLGLPLVYTVFGAAGLVPLMLIISFHTAILVPLTIVLIEVGRGRAGWRAAAGAAGRTAACNPVVVAMLTGAVSAALGLRLPWPLDEIARLLGEAATPCTLFALGATLAGHRLVGGWREHALLLVAKLAVMPLVVWLLAAHVFGLAPLWVKVAVVAAAIPTGSTPFLVASRYDLLVARASATAVVSTATSIATLSALLVWIGS